MLIIKIKKWYYLGLLFRFLEAAKRGEKLKSNKSTQCFHYAYIFSKSSSLQDTFYFCNFEFDKSENWTMDFASTRHLNILKSNKPLISKVIPKELWIVDTWPPGESVVVVVVGATFGNVPATVPFSIPHSFVPRMILKYPFKFPQLVPQEFATNQ